MKTSGDTIKVELYNRGCGNLKRTKRFNIASSLLSLFLTQPHFVNSIGYTGLNFRTRAFIKWEELQEKCHSSLRFTEEHAACYKKPFVSGSRCPS